MAKEQNVSSQAVLDVLQQEKIEIASSLTLARARNKELFEEVIRLTEILNESGVEPNDNIVSIDKNAEANIFNDAAFGDVGDWKNILTGFLDTLNDLVKES